MNTSQSGAAFADAGQSPTCSDIESLARRRLGDNSRSGIPEMATIDMCQRLPALDDDGDVLVEKEHVVPRDDQADLKFRGVLLGSVAHESAPKGRWKEYRIYRTTGGSYVFSRVGRSILDGERDKFEARIYNPKNPDTAVFYAVKTWDQAAVRFFEYDQLAKSLYRKLQIEFEERID